MHARGLGKTHADELWSLLLRISLLELHPDVLGRVLEPFPVAVRTLDALHRATMVFLRQQGQELRLATYDERLLAAADAMEFDAFSL